MRRGVRRVAETLRLPGAEGWAVIVVGAFLFGLVTLLVITTIDARHDQSRRISGLQQEIQRLNDQAVHASHERGRLERQIEDLTNQRRLTPAR